MFFIVPMLAVAGSCGELGVSCGAALLVLVVSSIFSIISILPSFSKFIVDSFIAVF